MKAVAIGKVEIDESGRLRVYPRGEMYDYIYRSGDGVHWDMSGKYLFSPGSDDWPHSDWFRFMLRAVRSEYGHALGLSDETEWVQIAPDLRSEIEAQK